MQHPIDKAEQVWQITVMKDTDVAVVSPLEVVSAPRIRRGNPLLHNALEAQGVTRNGVISELHRIALTGEKVTTEYRNGKEVKKVVTLDPSIQMQAIERLGKLLARADGGGPVTRTLTYRED